MLRLLPGLAASYYGIRRYRNSYPHSIPAASTYFRKKPFGE
jgi:hypothetical protein